MRSFARVLTAAATAAAALTLSSQASALPGTDPDLGKGAFAGQDSSYPARTTGQPAVLQRGLYVLGDSISNRPGVPYIVGGKPAGGPRNLDETADTSGGSTVAPYVTTAKNSLVRNRSAVRAVDGFTFHDHLVQKGYASNQGTTSVQDARASNAGTVFVELGTNDVSCMYRSAQMPRDAFGGIDNASKICDSSGIPVPTTAGARELVRQQIASDVYALVAALTQGDSTRCIMLSGLREVNIYGAKIEDYRWFNNVLRYIASGNPNVKFANLDLYWRSQAPNGIMWLDWNKRWIDYFAGQSLSYDVHPHMSKTADALANFAVYSAAAPKSLRNDLYPYGGCQVNG